MSIDLFVRTRKEHTHPQVIFWLISIHSLYGGENDVMDVDYVDLFSPCKFFLLRNLSLRKYRPIFMTL
jgi:hypothetical protein